MSRFDLPATAHSRVHCSPPGSLRVAVHSRLLLSEDFCRLRCEASTPHTCSDRVVSHHLAGLLHDSRRSGEPDTTVRRRGLTSRSLRSHEDSFAPAASCPKAPCRRRPPPRESGCEAWLGLHGRSHARARWSSVSFRACCIPVSLMGFIAFHTVALLTVCLVRRPRWRWAGRFPLRHRIRS